MLILIKLIAFLILVMGGLFLINPDTMKKYVSFWGKGSRMRVGAVISLIFGVIFLTSASQCRVNVVITIMGLISLIKGIFLIVSGPEKIKAMINKWQNKPQGTVRLLALVEIGIGILLLWAI